MPMQPVFPLNFSSAGKGPFMAGKAKNAPEVHFPGGNCDGVGGGGGSEVRDKIGSCYL